MIINKEAVDYIKNKGLQKGFSYEDVWKEEHAHAFTVAKCMTYDLLADIQDSLVSALEDGKPYQQWAKEIEQVMVAKGWWGVKPMVDPLTGETQEVQLGSPRRLETIYNVNMRQAYNVGNYERGQSSKVHTKMMYRVGNSKVHREEHLNWDGLILPKDDPWWDKHMPPNGYGCKCYVKFLTEAGAERLQEEGIWDKTSDNPNARKQVKTVAPPDTPKMYVNKRTGITYEGIQGITKGFEYNPGALLLRKQAEEKILVESKKKYDDSLEKVQKAVKSETKASERPVDYRIYNPSISVKYIPKEIRLPAKEYAKVMHELDTNFNEEWVKEKYIEKGIGKYSYFVEVTGFNTYKIIGKRKIT